MRRQARELASSLPPFIVEATRVAHTVAAGHHGRRRSGSGDRFWQFRRYQKGDSTHQIDWRRSAKSQRIYVREKEWETAQSIWIWRDPSPSMDFRSSQEIPTKLERATVLALASVILLNHGGEQVGILAHGAKPQSGPGVVSRLAEGLLHMEDPDAPSLPVWINVPRHSELIWISDFLTDVEQTAAAVQFYAQRGCRGHLLQTLDPAEVTLPYDGQVMFSGMEGEGSHLITNIADVRSAYEMRFAAHQASLADLARQHQWSFSTSFTNRPSEPVLLALWSDLIQGP